MNLLDFIDQGLNYLEPREKLIVVRRNGLENEPETLESIGQELDLTKERIRQIENRAYENLTKFFQQHREKEKLLKNLTEFLNPLGVKREDRLVQDIILNFQLQEDIIIQRKVRFFLKFSSLAYQKETQELRAFYAHEPKLVIKTNQLFEKLHRKIQKILIIQEKEFFELKRKLIKQHFQRTIDDYQSLVELVIISKLIGANPFGYFGIVSHPLICPRNLRDKIKAFFYHHQKPAHFSEIYQQLISFLDNLKEHHTLSWFKRVHLPSLHNELINHPDFVLVKRGVYGLNEWGIKGGQLKDLLIELFRKTQRPLSKEEIIERLTKEGSFNKATIQVYLSDQRLFQRLEDGRYILRK